MSRGKFGAFGGFGQPEPIIWIPDGDYFRRLLSDIGFERATQKQLTEFQTCIRGGPNYRKQVKDHLRSMRVHMYHQEASIIEQEYQAVTASMGEAGHSDASRRRSSIGQRPSSFSEATPRRYSMGQRPLSPVEESRYPTPPGSVTGRPLPWPCPPTSRAGSIAGERSSGVGERPMWFVPTAVGTTARQPSARMTTGFDMQTHRGSLAGTPPDSRSGSRRNGDTTTDSGGRSSRGGKVRKGKGRPQANGRDGDKVKSKGCCGFGGKK